MCVCVKVTLENCISDIYALATILSGLSSLSEIFGDLGEKISYYVISRFKAVESLLKKIRNFLEHSGKGTASSTYCINNH